MRLDGYYNRIEMHRSFSKISIRRNSYKIVDFDGEIMFYIGEPYTSGGYKNIYSELKRDVDTHVHKY